MVDVSSLEATTGGPELTMAAHPKSGQIVLLEMSHRWPVTWSPDQLVTVTCSVSSAHLASWSLG